MPRGRRTDLKDSEKCSIKKSKYLNPARIPKTDKIPRTRQHFDFFELSECFEILFAIKKVRRISKIRSPRNQKSHNP